jgi:hypothetical protein
MSAVITKQDIRSRDVLCNRGNGVLANPGNIVYTSLIRERKPIYQSLKSAKEKKRIVNEVFDLLIKKTEEDDQQAPGRFLKPCNKDDDSLWYEISDEIQVTKKIAQALREKPKIKKTKNNPQNATSSSATNPTKGNNDNNKKDNNSSSHDVITRTMTIAGEHSEEQNDKNSTTNNKLTSSMSSQQSSNKKLNGTKKERQKKVKNMLDGSIKIKRRRNFMNKITTIHEEGQTNSSENLTDCNNNIDGSYCSNFENSFSDRGSPAVVSNDGSEEDTICDARMEDRTHHDGAHNDDIHSKVLMDDIQMFFCPTPPQDDKDDDGQLFVPGNAINIDFFEDHLLETSPKEEQGDFLSSHFALPWDAGMTTSTPMFAPPDEDNNSSVSIGDLF